MSLLIEFQLKLMTEIKKKKFKQNDLLYFDSIFWTVTFPLSLTVVIAPSLWTGPLGPLAELENDEVEMPTNDGLPAVSCASKRFATFGLFCESSNNGYRFDGLDRNWLLPCLVDKHRPIDKCRSANRNPLRRSSLASMDPIDRRNSFETEHLSMHSSSSVDDYTIWK